MLTLLIFVAIPFTATAGPARSLSDVAVLALQHDPRTETAAALLDQSRAAREVALGGYRPDVGLTAAAGRARYESGQSPDPSRDPTELALTMTQPVYDFGRTASQVASANAHLQSARAASSAVAIDVIRDAMTAALQVDLAHRTLDTVTQNAKVLSEKLIYTRARFEAGDFTQTDVAQAEARHAGAVAQTESARAALEQAQAVVEQLVGAPVDVDLAKLPQLALPASLPDALAAVQKNPQMEAARNTLQGALEGVNAAHAQLRPRVDLVGEVGRDDDTRFMLSTTDYWAASLQVSVPLYARGVARAGVERAQAAAREQRAHLLNVQRALERSVRSDWADISAARSELLAAQQQKRAADVALEGMQAELDTGLRTVVDLLNAQQEVLDADLAVLNARYRQASSGIRLLAATGELQLR